MRPNLDRLIADLSDAERAMSARLTAARDLGAFRGSSTEELETLDALLRVAKEGSAGPNLEYAAGVGLGCLREGVIDAELFRALPRGTLRGFGDERSRRSSRRAGHDWRFTHRMSVRDTARWIDDVHDQQLDLGLRIRAAKRLGSASEDLELQAFDTLKHIACDPESPEMLARAAGIGFARLRVRQGIVDNLELANFNPAAFAGYVDEGFWMYKLLQRAGRQ